MKILFIAGLLLLSFLSGYAADWNESLAVQAALANNRDLRAARRTLDEAEARLRGAGRLSNPEIEVVVAGGRDFEGRIEIGLTQYFPLTARLRLEKSLSRLELEAARLEVEERERIISSQVRTAFLSLAAAREGQDLRRRQSDTASTTAKSLTTQAREGFVSSLDATQASLEASQLRADGETSRAEAAEAAGKLATLLGLPPSDPLPLKDNLSLPRSLPAARSPDGRPDLRLAAIAITAAEHDLGLARAMRWQDIGIGLFVEGERFRDEPEGIENEALLGMKLSLPLPVWQNGSAAVAEREATAARRQLMLEALQLAAAHQANSSWQQMKILFTAARQMEDDVLPLARKLLTDTQASHDRGETDLQSLFRARQRFIEVETTALEARIAFHRARAAWIFATSPSSN